jgi:hypothetical protein
MSPPPVVLIVGFPRSGTTLVRTALDAHPRLCAYPAEAAFLSRAASEADGTTLRREEAVRTVDRLALELSEEDVRRGLDHAFRGTDRRDLRGILLSVLKSRCRAENEDLVPLLKHTPTVFEIERAEQIFPDVKVLHVVRDPRGVVASHAARWPEGGLWHRIRGWKRAVAAARDWGQAHEERYHQFRYERLLRNPSQCLQSVCEFIGIPYHPKVTDLDYVTWAFDREEAGEKATRRFTEFDRSKIDQWREALGRYEVQLVESRCAREMQAFGYEPMKGSPPVLLASLYQYFERTRYVLAQMNQRLPF